MESWLFEGDNVCQKRNEQENETLKWNMEIITLSSHQLYREITISKYNGCRYEEWDAMRFKITGIGQTKVSKTPLNELFA